jgi:S1-C subfamily serine protease
MLILEDYEKAIANASSEYTDEYIESKILYTDPQLDLCLVEAKGYISPAIIADYNYQPKLFEKVFIVGGPTGNFPIIIDTYISSIVQREEIGLIFLREGGHAFMLVSEQIFPGHSGSPVFNQEGEVIGVVFASLETYGGLTISHKDIFELLSDYEDSL